MEQRLGTRLRGMRIGTAFLVVVLKLYQTRYVVWFSASGVHGWTLVLSVSIFGSRHDGGSVKPSKVDNCHLKY